jgi:cyclohexyl-isocyanide hydratase
VVPHDTHLKIGSLLFEGLDQIDLTGPFEVLSRLPNSTYRIYGKTAESVRDLKGLRLTPDGVLSDAPQLGVLHVPGGFGQEELMADAEVLAWLRQQAAGAYSVLSVCTGALLLGATGLLQGRRATTHWGSFHLLPYFGAIPVDDRVVVDGNWVFAAGVTAGIDGALRLAAELRGDDVARKIQLDIVYAPEPPFNSGTPETAPEAIVADVRRSIADITSRRELTARRIAGELGINLPGLVPQAGTMSLRPQAASSQERAAAAVRRVSQGSRRSATATGGSMPFAINLTVNGERHDVDIDDPRVTLLDLLRERMNLTGTKKGCDRGQCGACTVLIDGRRMNACLQLALTLDGAEVTTIEGLADGDDLHPVQEAFIQHDGFQCGYCTPGQIMSAVGLIAEGRAGEDLERIREGMSGNLCRCSAYHGITQAVQDATRRMAAEPQRKSA